MNSLITQTNNNRVFLEEEQKNNALKSIEKYQKLPQHQNIYHLLLGALGLQNWVNQYHLSVDFDFDQQSFLWETNILFTPFFSKLTFGQFKASLVMTEDCLDAVILIPKIAVELPQFSTHFYVAVDIWEESREVVILGLIRRDEIVCHKKNIQYSETEQSYIVPVSSFDDDFSSLYTYVKYLNPQKISLPKALPKQNSSIISSLERKIKAFLNQPELHYSYIWEDLQLTWEETCCLFSEDNFLKKIETALLERTSSQAINTGLQTTLKSASKKALNLFTWLDNQLDYVTESFTTTPESAYQFIGGAVRDAGEDIFKDIIDQLVSEKRIPLDDSRIVKIPFKLQDFDFELLIGVWLNEESSEKDKWSFLCILKPSSELHFPENVSLKISIARGDSDTVIMSSEEMFYPTILKSRFGENIMLDISYQESHYTENFVFSPSANESSLRSNFIQLTNHYSVA